ncbi:hypothetical protein FACS1894122_12600 [Alphaproteobacteria bacterium]|nr:hypothetical protein FACS1894122_12600 [Alphaproteobacteria bacterium]
MTSIAENERQLFEDFFGEEKELRQNLRKIFECFDEKEMITLIEQTVFQRLMDLLQYNDAFKDIDHFSQLFSHTFSIYGYYCKIFAEGGGFTSNWFAVKWINFSENIGKLKPKTDRYKELFEKCKDSVDKIIANVHSTQIYEESTYKCECSLKTIANMELITSAINSLFEKEQICSKQLMIDLLKDSEDFRFRIAAHLYPAEQVESIEVEYAAYILHGFHPSCAKEKYLTIIEWVPAIGNKTFVRTTEKIKAAVNTGSLKCCDNNHVHI